MRTYIYVDGFNLYYRALKGTSYKWLDLSGLFCGILKPHHDIDKIKYFTARVNSRPGGGPKPQRQDLYIRGLQAHCKTVEMVFGHFLIHSVQARLAHPEDDRRFVEILKTEEKGSDVNLAVHLLDDGWRNLYDCAVLVANDSDISEVMRLVKQLPDNKLLGLLAPGKGNPSQKLLCHADFHRRIRENALRNNQLPLQIPGTQYTKPSNW